MLHHRNNQLIIQVVVATAAVAIIGWFVFGRPKKPATDDRAEKKNKELEVDNSRGIPISPDTTKSAPKKAAGSSPASGDKKSESQNKSLHSKIEDLDKKGKALFKEKKYFEAAQAFTEALDLIETDGGGAEDASSALFRQKVTLMNNRSAMYEKGGLPELALDDCDTILDLDMKHVKARTRKLRILEAQENYSSALVEVCAIQLLFMKENRDKLRLGLPVPPPPVPQTKLEELLTNLVPGEVDKCFENINKMPKSSRPLPSAYTIDQLLKSYTGYNAWMAKSAKDGSVATLSADLPSKEDTDVESVAKRATILLKIGRRKVYDGDYENAKTTFLEAYDLVGENTEVHEAMEHDNLVTLLEWTAIVRHWMYDLEGSVALYEKCSSLDPLNSEILVKEACVHMDGGKQDEALKLFEKALELDPTAADALLHRANLRMLQQKPEEAKADLQRCIELRPNHILARLRLASIFTAMNDIAGANKQLKDCEQLDPNSSELESYRGEIAFTQGEYTDAQKHFKKAMELAKNNPTPYVNAALTILNTPPPPGQMPDTDEVVRLLEKAIVADPQFHQAYVQLGQLKLGTATDLSAARDVIQLYDQGLQYCRTAEELKDLCSMRILTVAQVEAATKLRMESFTMQ